MKIATVKLESTSPYSQSRFYQTPELSRENKADYEQRTWRDRLHVNDKGFVFIPPMAIKNCLSEAARYLSMQVPGKGKATYTKNFESGVLIIDPIVLPIKKEDVESETLHVPSDGKRGGGKRVLKTFPIIRSWSGDINITIGDEIITKDVLDAHLKVAGLFIGLGRFRARNNGTYGRFNHEIVSFKDYEV